MNLGTSAWNKDARAKVGCDSPEVIAVKLVVGRHDRQEVST